MQLSDFKLGSIVSVDGRKGVVSAIANNAISVIVDGLEYLFFDFMPDPVPLSPEEFIELGFKASGNGFVHPSGLRWHNVGIKPGTTGYSSWFSYGVKPIYGLKYVHEVQLLMQGLKIV